MRLSRLLVGVAVGTVLAFGGIVGQLAAQSATQGQEDEFLKGAYLFNAPGITAPKLKHHVYPKYTSDAMRAKIQGVVVLQAVVDGEGRVSRVRVIESLDKVLGLDESAMAAAKEWTFDAGTLEGRAVSVAIQLQLEFRLH